MDETRKGFITKDVSNIINATKTLVKNDNTVIAEHNKRYISEAEHIIELRSCRWTEGGYILYEGSKTPYHEEQFDLKKNSFQLKKSI